MKILALHNFYGSAEPSGENLVFEAETALLRSRGHDVRTFTRRSDEIRDQGKLGLVRGALATPWNPYMIRAVRRILEQFQPDVVHVHNTFPLISPGVFHAIDGSAARVITLHNYRLFCAAATPMREGRVCVLCLDRRSSWPAFQHGCYRSSRIASAPPAISVALHRRIGTWERKVDAFIALTQFQRERMTAAGLPHDRVWVKPNFFAGRPEVFPWFERTPRAVFVGRISEDKGVSDVVDAWLTWGQAAPELALVGDGPLRTELEGRVREANRENIRFVGRVSPQEAQRWIASSRLLVLASKWFEGFPLVLCEAFASGTPALVSGVGALPQLVGAGAGAVFRMGDVRHLLEVASGLWNHPRRLSRMALRARYEFDSRYTEDINYEQLMNVYDKAIRVRRLASRSDSRVHVQWKKSSISRD
ncbi:MAG: glycosyltransferase family 4 protein [Rubricoccaceae bacterium]|nr:glycosyltransferase family 4 protein [Rubricoccaceae bacterium]